MRRVLIAAAVLAAIAAAGIVVSTILTLPPARLALSKPWDDGTIPGVLHVHTNRSDGRSTPEEVAAAAARAGLRFLVFTDHGDGTSEPDPPIYRSGVLCLDAVEISTTGGHVVAIGMPPAPYPLAGEPGDVVEDVKRFGGFAVAAHPDSPKPELRWRDWMVPVDGVEVLNPDTAWRQWRHAVGWRSRARLFEALSAYALRPAEAITELVQRSRVLDEAGWNTLTARRRLVLLEGTDAHGHIALRGGDPAETRFSLPLPSYEASFRVLSVHVRPDRPLSGDARADASIVARAIRSGHLYTVVDGVASPPAFDLMATNAHGTVREGDVLGVAGPLTVQVRSNAPPDFTTVVFEGDRVIQAHQQAGEFTLQLPERAAVYRVEIRSPQPDRAAWITSNPIYVRAFDAPTTAGPTAGSEPSPSAVGDSAAPGALGNPNTGVTFLFDGKSTAGWQVEYGPGSNATIELAPLTTGRETIAAAGAAELRFRYELAGGPKSTQSAALVYDLPAGMAPGDRIAFSVRAERPMRLSVQLRAPAVPAGPDAPPGVPRRWQRSVYVDAVERERTVSLDDLTAVGGAAPPHPVPSEVRTLLFVVDTTNTRPGAAGRIALREVNLDR